jgi:Zn-dependent peptidase ImmA (M78 family)
MDENSDFPRTIHLSYRKPKTKEERANTGLTWKHNDGLVEIFINANRVKDNREFINTLFHELAHAAHFFYDRLKRTKKQDAEIHRKIYTFGDLAEVVFGNNYNNVRD